MLQEAPNHWCHVVLFKYVGGGELKRPATSSKPVDNPAPPQEEEEPQQQGAVTCPTPTLDLMYGYFDIGYYSIDHTE